MKERGLDYYNEWEQYPADWIRNLQAAGHLPAGQVDERSIVNVQAKDLEGVRQAHFFAGIGGWPLALQRAGWPEDEEVWTGSCPCQPFSVAGSRKGKKDKRHVWPEFRRLISERRPSVVFGEQVASPAGRKWFAGVRADLEELGYAVGGGDLCAAGVSSPQIRQRIFWVASAEGFGHGANGLESESGRRERSTGSNGVHVARGLACAEGGIPGNGELQRGGKHGLLEKNGRPGRRACGQVRSEEVPAIRMGRAAAFGRIEECSIIGRGAPGGQEEGRQQRPWSDFDALPCRDGAYRRVEPGTFPLAHGIPARVGKLRAYGNAIVSEVAVEFIKAYLEARLAQKR